MPVRNISMVLCVGFCAAGISRAAGDHDLEIQVQVMDAGQRDLPRFVKGETILVRVRLVDVAALHQRDVTDQIRSFRNRGNVEDLVLAEELERRTISSAGAIVIGSKEQPWVERVHFQVYPIVEAADRQAAERSEAIAALRRVDFLKSGSPIETLSDPVTDEYWELDTKDLSAQEHRLVTRFQKPGRTPAEVTSELQAEVMFKIIAQDQATPIELARVQLRLAQRAENAGNLAAAIAAAQEALKLGPEDAYDVATLHSLMGRVHEARSELMAALQAFQEAKKIAEQNLAGRSRLPELMERDIQRLQSKLLDQ